MERNREREREEEREREREENKYLDLVRSKSDRTRNWLYHFNYFWILNVNLFHFPTFLGC